MWVPLDVGAAGRGAAGRGRRWTLRRVDQGRQAGAGASTVVDGTVLTVSC